MIQIRLALPTELANISALAQTANVYVPSQNDLAHTDVVCLQGNVVAFASWQVVCDEATLLAIAVDCAFRGQGYGIRLLTHSEQRLCKQGIRHFFLEVRASNIIAQALYRRMGYQIIATRKDYYPTAIGREAALVMAKR